MVEAVEVSGGDEGSTVRRNVTVTYNRIGMRARLPENLFAKSTPTLLTRLSSGAAARAEYRFFTGIRDELPIEAPTLVHSSTDRQSGRSVQLFLDLVATKGARFCRHSTPINRDQAEQMVDTLATLHSRFYNSKRFETDLRWLPTYEDFLRAGERTGIRVGHEQAMSEASDVIPADVLARSDEIWPMTVKGLAVHSREPRTVLHSDVHLGNWYITDEGRMGLGDWQCICVGHWARDFAYAVSTSLAEHDRRSWERDLLARYLERMGENCALHASFERAWDDYRQQLFAALLMWTPTLCHPPTMPDMQPVEMSLLMIKRITTAISDLAAFDSQEQT
jgi:aminoglycoside phosphotransferase (APT) family kinase protein